MNLVAATVWILTTFTTPSLQVRLETHLTSHASRPGDSFAATVIAPYRFNGEIRIPAGAIVYGRVREARTVGVGLGRERASLLLAFDRYELPDGRVFPLRGFLRAIENAREDVARDGRIRGVLAASSPNGLVRGFWGRPSATLLTRSPVGLTGLSGRLWTEYTMGPVGVAGLMAARMAVFRMPEPEIHLPPGAEMRVAVTSLAPDAPAFSPDPEGELSEAMAATMRTFESAVTRAPHRNPAADLINVAIRGTRHQIEAAFLSAGWYPAEPLTKRSFARSWSAFTKFHGYATAPVSRLYYRGVEPELVFQKSLNTISKRHHIRLWPAGEVDGIELWLGAATHDVGVAFEPSRVALTHRIDSRLDRERTKLVNDLLFTGCAEPVAYADRPALAESTLRRKTDGRLAVITLYHDCEITSWTSSHDPAPRAPGSRASRLLRRVALETRSYLMRDNAYYWAIRALRRRPPTEARLDGFR